MLYFAFPRNGAKLYSAFLFFSHKILVYRSTRALFAFLKALLSYCLQLTPFTLLNTVSLFSHSPTNINNDLPFDKVQKVNVSSNKIWMYEKHFKRQNVITKVITFTKAWSIIEIEYLLVSCYAWSQRNNSSDLLSLISDIIWNKNFLNWFVSWEKEENERDPPITSKRGMLCLIYIYAYICSLEIKDCHKSIPLLNVNNDRDIRERCDTCSGNFWQFPFILTAAITTMTMMRREQSSVCRLSNATRTWKPVWWEMQHKNARTRYVPTATGHQEPICVNIHLFIPWLYIYP